ncbi:hypothetical protein DUI87_15874 [Hirundo rustica rustica]|uniref:Uncharacterized protein n=1 Tax=Hirundo rustica rustica TaxID=333673 RepID=A0A3M0K5T9_HIRRU|nr:hypothetical protein DUI87_15874 [Hirundo rustica rustica]
MGPLLPKTSQELVQGPTAFTDGSGRTGKAIATWRDGSEWQVLEDHEDESAQLVQLTAAVMAFQRFSQEPFNLVTDSTYVAKIAQRLLDHSVLKEVSNAALFHLLKTLWCAIQAQVHPYYILHMRSHTNLPRALEIWQTDINQVAEFGRLNYVHVPVDTFSSAMWASAHTGEKARDVIAHWRQAFAILGIPSALKADNGPAYVSQKVRQFLQFWDTGVRWVPAKCVHPDLRPQRKNAASRQAGDRDQNESYQVDEPSSDDSDADDASDHSDGPSTSRH